jgi:excisionase family DNA binding protein
MGMTPSKEKSINITEFANLYNRTRPLGKDFMPLEPSFLKLLCEQGKIRYSELPAHDGRKKDVIMIPESELDTVDILLNGDEAIEKGPTKTMTTKEVAEFLGTEKTYVCNIARNGKLKSAKVSRGGRYAYSFDEEDVLKYAEEHPRLKRKKKEETNGYILPETPVKTQDELQKQVNDLAKANDELKSEILRLTEENDRLRNSYSSEDRTFGIINAFEAYRRGFRDGFQMGGAH